MPGKRRTVSKNRGGEKKQRRAEPEPEVDIVEEEEEEEDVEGETEETKKERLLIKHGVHKELRIVLRRCDKEAQGSTKAHRTPRMKRDVEVVQGNLVITSGRTRFGFVNWGPWPNGDGEGSRSRSTSRRPPVPPVVSEDEEEEVEESSKRSRSGSVNQRPRENGDEVRVSRSRSTRSALKPSVMPEDNEKEEKSSKKSRTGSVNQRPRENGDEVRDSRSRSTSRRLPLSPVVTEDDEEDEESSGKSRSGSVNRRPRENGDEVRGLRSKSKKPTLPPVEPEDNEKESSRSHRSRPMNQRPRENTDEVRVTRSRSCPRRPPLPPVVPEDDEEVQESSRRRRNRSVNRRPGENGDEVRVSRSRSRKRPLSPVVAENNEKEEESSKGSRSRSVNQRSRENGDEVRVSRSRSRSTRTLRSAVPEDDEEVEESSGKSRDRSVKQKPRKNGDQVRVSRSTKTPLPPVVPKDNEKEEESSKRSRRGSVNQRPSENDEEEGGAPKAAAVLPRLPRSSRRRLRSDASLEVSTESQEKRDKAKDPECLTRSMRDLLINHQTGQEEVAGVLATSEESLPNSPAGTGDNNVDSDPLFQELVNPPVPSIAVGAEATKLPEDSVEANSFLEESTELTPPPPVIRPTTSTPPPPSSSESSQSQNNSSEVEIDFMNPPVSSSEEIDQNDGVAISSTSAAAVMTKPSTPPETDCSVEALKKRVRDLLNTSASKLHSISPTRSIPNSASSSMSDTAEEPMEIDQVVQAPASPKTPPPQQNNRSQHHRELSIRMSTPLHFQNDEQDSFSDSEQVSVKDYSDQQLSCDISAILGEDCSVFNSPPLSPLRRVMWYCCVMWDAKMLSEILEHEQQRGRLHSSLALGRYLVESCHCVVEGWPGLQHMKWKKPFMVLDIVTDNFDTSDVFPRLTVQEKLCSDNNNPSDAKDSKTPPPPVFWDLVVYPQCAGIANEMVRQFQNGVKTSVFLWGCQKNRYSTSRDLETEGEILFRPTCVETCVVSVLIFHHENISKERAQLIYRSPASRKSELWADFQNPKLECRPMIYGNIESNQVTVEHLEAHFEKSVLPSWVRENIVEETRPWEPMGLVEEDAVEDEEDEEESGDDLHGYEEFLRMSQEDWEVEGDEETDRLLREIANELELRARNEQREEEDQVDQGGAEEDDQVEAGSRVAERLFVARDVPVENPKKVNTTQVDGAGASSSKLSTVAEEKEAPKVNGDLGTDHNQKQNRAEAVPDSQQQFLFTQELAESSDSEEEAVPIINGIAQRNGSDRESNNESFVTCDETFSGDEMDSRKNSPAKRSPVKGLPNGRMVNGKGAAEKGKGVASTTKRNGIVQNQRPNLEEDSEEFRFSDIISEL